MDETSYDPLSRSRLCSVCAVSNSAPMAGGELTCTGCGSTIHLEPRTLQPLGAGEESAAALQTRLQRLRKQAESYNSTNPYSTAQAPEGLEDLADLDEVADHTLEVVLQRYRQTLETCLAHSTDPVERRLFWLTNKLNNIYVQRAESVNAWGAIQTSMDALSDDGYQTILRCLAANKARQADQLEHAEAWLDLADPAPGILELNYSYRTSRAMLHGAKGRWPEMLELVGESNDDVPFPSSGRLVVGCCRVTALEQLGRHQVAETAMRELLVATGPLQHTLLRMCRPGNLFEPVMAVWRRVDRKTGGRRRWMLMAILLAGVSGLAFYGWVLHKQSRHFSGYRAVQAKIVKVHSREIKKGRSPRVGVGVDYTFEVKGKTYTGHRATHDSRYFTFQDGRKAEAKLARLRGRSTITAYYDPTNPRRAVLERGASEIYLYAVLAWAGALVVLLLFLLLFRFHLRRRRALNPRN